jgi:hypothetical protein
MFMQLCAEAGLRVSGLVRAVEHGERGKGKGKGKETDEESKGKEFNAEVRAWLYRLRTLNSLWMSPDLYRAFSNAMPDDERFERIESGCEACILAVVGGNPQAILDLRTSLIGRKKRGHESRLWGLVDAWTRRSGEQAEWIRGQSERVGRLVLKERRHARRRRRRQRRKRRLERENGGTRKTESETEIAAVGGGNCADDLEDEPDDVIGDAPGEDGRGRDDAEEHDFEGFIIDYYRGFASRSNLAVNIPHNQSLNPNVAQVDEDALHPAFRDSVAYNPTSGTFHRRPQQLPPQQEPSTTNKTGDHPGAASRSTFYTQSAYSQDSGFDSGFGGSSSAPSKAQEILPPVPPLPSTIRNPFVKATFSRTTREKDRHIAEKRADSYQKLVGIPEENPASTSPPSDETVREYMRKLWMPTPEAGSEEDGGDYGDDEDARNARVEKALTDAYGDRSRTKEETKEKHLTTWNEMMKKGGAKK